MPPRRRLATLLLLVTLPHLGACSNYGGTSTDGHFFRESATPVSMDEFFAGQNPDLLHFRGMLRCDDERHSPRHYARSTSEAKELTAVHSCSSWSVVGVASSDPELVEERADRYDDLGPSDFR